MNRPVVAILMICFIGCSKPETVYVTQRVEVPVAVTPPRPNTPEFPELEIIQDSDGPSEIAGKVARNLRRLLLYSQELERVFATVWSSKNDTIGPHPHP